MSHNEHTSRFLFPLLLLLAACSTDDAPYPNLLTEFADGKTDHEGRLTLLTLDDGTAYPVQNALTGLKADVVYRLVAGFTVDDGQATLYSATSAYILRDSTIQAAHDPTGVDAAWLTPRYINLQLRPKTQGGEHGWGYTTDSTTNDTTYLTLHHRQTDDPTAYSTTVYASLPLDRLSTPHTVLRIKTWQGDKVFRF